MILSALFVPDNTYLMSGVILILSVVIILWSVKTFIASQYQSVYAMMVATFTFFHGYGYFIYPYLPRSTFDEQRFDPVIYTKMGFGLTIILVCLVLIGLMRQLAMPRIPASGARGVNLAHPIFLWAFVAVVAFSMFHFFNNIDDFKRLFRVIASGNYSAYYEERVQNIFDRAARNPIINNLNALIMGMVSPLLMTIVGYEYFRSKRYLPYFLVLLGINILAALIRFQKAPIIVVLLLLGFSYIFATDIITRKRIPIFKLITFASVVLVFVSLIYSVLGFSSGFFDALYKRIFFSSIFTSYGHYYVFPDLHPFIHYGGSRTQNLIFGFGQDTSFITGYSTAPLISGQLFRGHAFNMNTSILGDSYANNGYWGVAQGAFILFGFFAALDIFFARSKKYLPYAPIVAFFVPEVITILNGGMTLVIGRYYILIPIVYLFLFKPTTVPRR